MRSPEAGESAVSNEQTTSQPLADSMSLYPAAGRTHAWSIAPPPTSNEAAKPSSSALTVVPSAGLMYEDQPRSRSDVDVPTGQTIRLRSVNTRTLPAGIRTSLISPALAV